ncbi:MAG: Cu2+-exporting ATPase [archaeon GW2011_AR21]|nr:MAG: Cu2+-exporting ATPase [archaeon GW2011_AR21]
MAKVKDQICGMLVDEKTAKFFSVRNGKTFYFCSKGCKEKFEGKGGEMVQEKSLENSAKEEGMEASKAKPAGSPGNSKNSVFAVSGMHCASCALSIERNVSRMQGVKNANVNFANERLTVQHDESIDSNAVMKAVESAGYKAMPLDFSNAPESQGSSLSLKVIGMNNPHCVGIVEAALKNKKGILKAELNFATERASIAYNPSIINAAEIKRVIKGAGYEPVEESLDKEKEARLREIRVLRNELLLGVVLTIPVVLLSFPEIFGSFLKDPLRLYVLLLLALPVQFYIGKRFYKGFWISLLNKTASMDSLIAIGTSAAFVYSLFATFKPEVFGTEVYYDTAVVIITLIVLGRYLEAIAKGKTSEAIKKLMGLRPKNATVLCGREHDFRREQARGKAERLPSHWRDNEQERVFKIQGHKGWKRHGACADSKACGGSTRKQSPNPKACGQGFKHFCSSSDSDSCNFFHCLVFPAFNAFSICLKHFYCSVNHCMPLRPGLSNSDCNNGWHRKGSGERNSFQKSRSLGDSAQNQYGNF